MRYIILCLLSIQVSITLRAQESVNDSLQAASDSISSAWSFETDAYYYILPGGKNTTTLMGYTDHKAFHFEARYNYEDLQSASLFAGYRFEGGRGLKFSVTPMLGFVFGNTDGIVPGLEASLAWKKLDFYTENEHVFDFAGKAYNFFYSWTELAITPFRNFRTGISGNRSRLYQSDLEIQKGIFTEYSFWKITAGVHYFNPFSNDDFVIATLAVEF